MGQRYEKNKKNVSENKKTLEKLHTDKETLRNEYAPLSLLESIQGILDDEAVVAIQEVRAAGEVESQRLETEADTAENEKKQITEDINSELAKLNAGLEKLRKAGDIEFGKKAVEKGSHEYKKQIEKFKALLGELGETASNTSANYEGSLGVAINAESFMLDDESTEQFNDDENKPKTLHLSGAEVNARWQQAVQSIDAQIDNYKDALLARGVPEGTWLNNTLAEHKAAMLEQEGYNLDAASGHANDSVHSPDAYHYPGDYSAFYDNLADEFRSYCLEGTNPNFSKGPEWQNNCQRCVPTYELRRRGIDATVYPSTHGTDHLSHYPFDVWENPQILTGSGNGKADIESAMSSWGDGARAQVVVFWNDGFGTNGHTFIAEQRNGSTHYLDPQTDNSDYSSCFADVLSGRTQFCRIDNLNTSSYINDCYEQEKFG